MIVVLGVDCGRIGVAGGEAEFGNCRPEGAAVLEDYTKLIEKLGNQQKTQNRDFDSNLKIEVLEHDSF